MASDGGSAGVAKAAVNLLRKELSVLEEEQRVDDAMGRVVIISSKSAGPQSFRSRSRRKAGAGAGCMGDTQLARARPALERSQLEEALALRESAKRQSGSPPKAADRTSAVSPPSSHHGSMRNLLRARPASGGGNSSFAASNIGGSPLQRATSGRGFSNGSPRGATESDADVARRIEAAIATGPKKLRELEDAHVALLALLSADMTRQEDTVKVGPSDAVERLRQAVERQRAQRRAVEESFGASSMGGGDSFNTPSAAALAEVVKRKQADERRRLEAQRAAEEANDEAFRKMRESLRAEVLLDVFGAAPIVPPPLVQASFEPIHVRDCPFLSGPDVSLPCLLSGGLSGDTGGTDLFEELVRRERAKADATDENQRQQALAEQQAAEVAAIAERVKALREPVLRRQEEMRQLALSEIESVDGDSASPSLPASARSHVDASRESAEGDEQQPRQTRVKRDAAHTLAAKELDSLCALQDEADAVRAERQAQLDEAVARRLALNSTKAPSQADGSPATSPARDRARRRMWRAPALPQPGSSDVDGAHVSGAESSAAPSQRHLSAPLPVDDEEECNAQLDKIDCLIRRLPPHRQRQLRSALEEGGRA